MPIFEYTCPNCSHTWELLIIAERPYSEKCPNCNVTGIRQISAPVDTGYRFSGKGLHSNDGSTTENKN